MVIHLSNLCPVVTSAVCIKHSVLVKLVDRSSLYELKLECLVRRSNYEDVYLYLFRFNIATVYFKTATKEVCCSICTSKTVGTTIVLIPSEN